MACAVSGCTQPTTLKRQFMCDPHWEAVPYHLKKIIRAGERGRNQVAYYRAIEEARQIAASMPKGVARVTWRDIVTQPRSA